MKIYKVNLNPSNPVEKVVKVPVGSNYGIQINWDYEKFPTFTDSDVDTENGKLTYTEGVIEENTSFTDVNGQKIFTDLPVIENVGNKIIFTYGKNETFDANKLDNFGAIKIIGVDTDDYDVDVGGSATIEGITNIDGKVLLSANNGISFDPLGWGRNDYEINLTANGMIPTIASKYIMLSGESSATLTSDYATTVAAKQNVYICAQEQVQIGNSNNNIVILNCTTDNKTYLIGNDNGTEVLNMPISELGGGGGGSSGDVDGIYLTPVETDLNIVLNKNTTVYKYTITADSASEIIFDITAPEDTNNRIIVFWLWLVFDNWNGMTISFNNTTFLGALPIINHMDMVSNGQVGEIMLAFTSTDNGQSWIANTQWYKQLINT